MSYYIGSELNVKEVAALQAVADGSMGAQYAIVSKLPDTIRSIRECQEIVDATPAEIAALLAKLEAAGLVEFATHAKFGGLVGLTDDGKRCNRITVVDLF